MDNKSKITIHPLPSSPEGPIKHAPIEKEVGQLSVDIFKTATDIIILAPIAGINKEEVNLTITDDVLVIKGTRTPRFSIPEEDYYTKECFWGNFSRSIVLPQEADVKGISATFENNVLEIHIPRVEKERTKVIKIKA